MVLVFAIQISDQRPVSTISIVPTDLVTQNVFGTRAEICLRTVERPQDGEPLRLRTNQSQHVPTHFIDLAGVQLVDERV